MAITKPKSSQRVRLVDIAEKAGVNRTAVGKVLLGSGENVRVSEETADRIRRVAREMNYRPNSSARQLKGAPSSLLGLMLPVSPNQASQTLMFAVEKEAHRRGFRSMIGHMDLSIPETREYVEDFDARGVEAIICLGTVWPDAHEVFEDLDRVIYTVQPAFKHRYCVELDRAEGSRLAVNHLFETGRKRVGVVLSRVGTRTSDLRRDGFFEEMRSNGMTDPEPYLWVPRNPDNPLDQIDEGIDYLVNEMGCDALVTGDDRWAVALIKEMHRRGLSVPRDVAVVGCSNHEIGIAIDPELTTIDPNCVGIATALLDMVVQLRMKEPGDLEDLRVDVQPGLIVRESSRPK